MLSVGLSRPFSDETGDFNGTIDDLRLFRRELNATEISQLYGSGTGDYAGSISYFSEANRVLKWKDSIGTGRDANSRKFIDAPTVFLDSQTEKRMLSFDYGDRLWISGPVTMPMTIMMVGRDSGIGLPNREYFTNSGWRFSNNGNFSLSRWNDSNPGIFSSNPSNLLSLVEWSLKQYE